MNIYNIIDELGKTDQDLNEKISRRNMFKSASSMGKKVAIAAIPVAFAGSLKNAYAGSQASIVEVLQFALTLEYLENEFYEKGIAAAGLIPSDRKTIFTQIGKHEASHVKFLKDTITALGSSPGAKPTFDFTAKGTYPTVFTDYQTFLTLSQAFEDTGVRAYKGRAAELMSSDAVLTAALQIHSVEARHASMVRRLRAEKGWITGNSGSPAAVYEGEDNVTQAGTNIVTALGYNSTICTQAFDEPLTPDKVLAIAGQFIA